jgi:hypothetical protein
MVTMFRSRYTHGAYIFGVAGIYLHTGTVEVPEARCFAPGQFVDGQTLRLSRLAAIEGLPCD